MHVRLVACRRPSRAARSAAGRAAGAGRGRRASRPCGPRAGRGRELRLVLRPRSRRSSRLGSTRARTTTSSPGSTRPSASRSRDAAPAWRGAGARSGCRSVAPAVAPTRVPLRGASRKSRMRLEIREIGVPVKISRPSTTSPRHTMPAPIGGEHARRAGTRRARRRRRRRAPRRRSRRADAGVAPEEREQSERRRGPGRTKPMNMRTRSSRAVSRSRTTPQYTPISGNAYARDAERARAGATRSHRRRARPHRTRCREHGQEREHHQPDAERVPRARRQDLPDRGLRAALLGSAGLRFRRRPSSWRATLRGSRRRARAGKSSSAPTPP